MNMLVSVSRSGSGLLFGPDIGVIAGAKAFITDHFCTGIQPAAGMQGRQRSMAFGAAIGRII